MAKTSKNSVTTSTNAWTPRRTGWWDRAMARTCQISTAATTPSPTAHRTTIPPAVGAASGSQAYPATRTEQVATNCPIAALRRCLTRPTAQAPAQCRTTGQA
ncbi:hypothetical protein Aglo01_39210 [Actinokineospora globicatena]|nr:hypothetical protein Aglo01_39210 [Actinokineospora globicatena]GLW86151.1 hypothetical protein Aglo02_37900 [Actinokineospora globicatena]